MSELKITVDDFGCHDGSCYLKGKYRFKGQHTNGGCNCLDGLKLDKSIEIRKALMFRDAIIESQSAEIERLKADNARMREALEIISKGMASISNEVNSRNLINFIKLAKQALKGEG